jgi:hypothetical protein
MPYFHRELLPVSVLFLIIGIGATVFARAWPNRLLNFERPVRLRCDRSF